MSCFCTVLYQISWNGEIVKTNQFWSSLDLNLLNTIIWNVMFSREFGISCSHVIFLAYQAGSRQSYYKPMSHTILPAHFIYSNSHQHSLRHNLNILTQCGARRQVFRFWVPGWPEAFGVQKQILTPTWPSLQPKSFLCACTQHFFVCSTFPLSQNFTL